MNLDQMMEDMGRRAREAARDLARLNTKAKNEALKIIAARLREAAGPLKAENEKDLAAARENGLSSAMIDRLTLSDKVIESMSRG